jgi:hypothetical protein
MAKQSQQPFAKEWRRGLAIFIGLASSIVSFRASAQDAAITTGNQVVTSAVRAPLDYYVFTTYTLTSNNSMVNWVVEGYLKKTSGAYGAGRLGPFGKVGSLVEGFPMEDIDKKTVTRYIYILDIAAGSQQNGVNLNVYIKTDKVTSSDDKVSVTFDTTIMLPLVGGSSATPFMAANADFIFVGTDQGPLIAEVEKKTLAVAQINYQPSPYFITGITANAYGYVTVAFNAPGGDSANSLVIAPDASLLDGDGGALFMSNPIEASNPYSVQ